MAARKKKSRKRKRSKKSAPLVPAARKREVLGLVLMVFALLLALALVTYQPADAEVARSFSLSAALDPGEHRARNALGLVGASIAYLLVPGFLGYVTLLPTALLGVWGYVTLRHDREVPLSLPLLTVLGVAGAFLVACFIGWFAYTPGSNLLPWAGSLGIGAAGWMQRVFGAAGSFVLLLLMLTVTVLLAADHDLQRSMNRLEELMRRLRAWFGERFAHVRTWSADRRERHAERRAEREPERKAARAKRRKEALQRQRKSAPQAASHVEQPHPKATHAPSDARAAGSRAASPETARAPAEGDVPPRRVNDMFRSPSAPSESAPPAHVPPEHVPPPPQDLPSHDESAEHAEQGVTMQVQGQVKEEKADTLDRPAEVPADDETPPYDPPDISLLDEATDEDQQIDYDELEQNKQILLDKLDTYNVTIQDIRAVVGPTVTRYELTPAPGVKISRIKSLEDDLAMAMAAHSIRVIAPIPGKSAVGVEIPNRHRELVRLKSVIGTARFRDAQMELPVPIGKTIEGEVFIEDLARMPHLLIAGATGSGKSVGLNALITGLLYACHPANLKFVIIDPKKIELQQYAALHRHFLAIPEDSEDAIITDFEQALGVLKSCEKEMEQRYDLLAEAGVRSIRDYNRKLTGGLLDGEEYPHMPYIVVVVDELADLMMTAGKDIEGPIARLAQMARAVGIHLVLATQRPSVDVITGLIKANFPSRIAYQVASRVDSRTILDLMGAEGLVGNGDLLYMNGSNITRLQGPFVSLEEVERINGFIAGQRGAGPYWLPSLEEAGHGPTVTLGVEDTDEFFEDAAHIIVRRQQGSVSLLQRKLSVGYTRAARIVDQLEEAGIVGPFVGTKARDVLVEDVEELERLLAGEEEEKAG